MQICFIIDNPETTRHPVIGTVIQTLSQRHAVRLLDVGRVAAEEAIAQDEAHPTADIYLLKSHSFQALQVADHLERRGALVVNSWASSSACQDRVLMAQRITQAGLPGPLTWKFSTAESERLSSLPFPLMLKSRYSCRGDLVAKVSGAGELQTLVQQRQKGPFILQEFVQGDGSDVKVWVIAEQVFAARRSIQDSAIPAEQLPNAWRSLALEVGRVFGLRLYGVDLLVTRQGPVLVDVNSFPGFRGVAGAAAALAALVETLALKKAWAG